MQYYEHLFVVGLTRTGLAYIIDLILLMAKRHNDPGPENFFQNQQV